MPSFNGSRTIIDKLKDVIRIILASSEIAEIGAQLSIAGTTEHYVKMTERCLVYKLNWML